MFNLKKVSHIAHQFLEQVIEQGDRVVDATAGNGYDTEFLAALVGSNGMVYAFDIQARAIKSTAQKLQEAGLDRQVKLVVGSHEHLKEVVSGKVKAVCYNLGYLPGGDHRLVTRADTTRISLEEALNLLLPGGVITLTLYPGHDEGSKELDLLLPFCRTFPVSDYSVAHFQVINSRNKPPQLIIIQRRQIP